MSTEQDVKDVLLDMLGEEKKLKKIRYLETLTLVIRLF